MLINLTPHVIVIVNSDGGTIAVDPSGNLARCKVSEVSAGQIDGVDLARTTMGTVEGLPAPALGVLYIVSMIVRTAVPGRTDVASPGALIRDAKGVPIGCKGLVVNQHAHGEPVRQGATIMRCLCCDAVLHLDREVEHDLDMLCEACLDRWADERFLFCREEEWPVREWAEWARECHARRTARMAS